MTRAWSMQARRPRRRRFLAGVLAFLLVVGVVAGALLLVPGAFPGTAGAAGPAPTPTPALAGGPAANPAGSAAAVEPS
ncbi:MAG TPA: hypothetical protein VF302_07285, partial [Candidatus Limnocylindrales bacterium]